jgi:hypothetical protein
MLHEIPEEIDYEHLDDLPLFEHIEWKQKEENKNSTRTEILPLEYVYNPFRYFLARNLWNYHIRPDRK